MVQLLACVIALMICMAVTVPTLKSQLARANSVSCQSHMREVLRALSFYRADNAGFWPVRQVRTQADGVRDNNTWVSLLIEGQYIDAPNRFGCPADINAARWDPAAQEFFRRQIAHAPSYGLNQLTWRAYQGPPGVVFRAQPMPDRPTSTILIADLGPDIPSTELPPHEEDRRAFIELARDCGRLVADDGFRVGVIRPPRSWLTGRHGGALNLMTMGGNVVRAHRVSHMMTQIPEVYYDDCATKDCTYCNVFKAAHYDFSASELFWWTGPYRPTGTPAARRAHDHDGPHQD